MSLPTMRAVGPGSWGLRLAAGLVAVAGLASGCGQATDEAQAAAARALDRVEGLEERVSELEGSLRRASEGMEEAGAIEKRFSGELEELDARLGRSLRGLRAELGELRSSVSGEAASALDQAQAVARDLAILEQRYDYHLRRYHGGGG